jgi:peptidoglycan/LPS O-acetylase OafA/YrhL
MHGGLSMAVLLSDGSLPFSDLEKTAVQHRKHRPDIDGLRAVAAISVVGVHVGFVPGGFIGVDVFFVISGYLISGLILRALIRGTFSSFDFYARRAKRIFPALIAVLVTVTVLGWLVLLAGEYQQLGRVISNGLCWTPQLSHVPLA